MEAHEWTSVLGFAARQGCKMRAARAPADFSKAFSSRQPLWLQAPSRQHHRRVAMFCLRLFR